MIDRKFIEEVVNYHIGEALKDIARKHDVSMVDFWYLCSGEGYDAGIETETYLCDIIENALDELIEEETT